MVVVVVVGKSPIVVDGTSVCGMVVGGPVPEPGVPPSERSSKIRAQNACEGAASCVTAWDEGPTACVVGVVVVGNSGNVVPEPEPPTEVEPVVPDALGNVVGAVVAGVVVAGTVDVVVGKTTWGAIPDDEGVPPLPKVPPGWVPDPDEPDPEAPGAIDPGVENVGVGEVVGGAVVVGKEGVEAGGADVVGVVLCPGSVAWPGLVVGPEG